MYQELQYATEKGQKLTRIQSAKLLNDCKRQEVLSRAQHTELSYLNWLTAK